MQDLIKINPNIHKEIVKFISYLSNSQNDELRLKVKMINEPFFLSYDIGEELEMDFDFEFLNGFINSKKGKFYDKEIAD